MKYFWIIFLCQNLMYANMEKVTDIYTHFFEMIYKASYQNLPQGKNIANPKFRDACINNDLLYNEVTIGQNTAVHTKEDKIYELTCKQIRAMIWTGPTSLNKADDYKKIQTQDYILRYWKTQKNFMEFINLICEAFDFVDAKSLECMKSQLINMLEECWGAIDQRAFIEQGKYLNGYIADGFKTRMQLNIEQLYEIKNIVPLLNHKMKIVCTTMKFFDEINDEVGVFLNATWQLEVQLISYAAFYLLRETE